MDIILDFDGTCVTHDFPRVGKDIGAVPVLKELVANGHRLILFTMRSNREKLNDPKDDTVIDITGSFLDDAVEWFKANDIPLYGIQTNPTQHNWTSSPKAYGQLHIDDAGLGIPLTRDRYYSDRPFVNWQVVRHILFDMGLLRRKEAAYPEAWGKFFDL